MQSNGHTPEWTGPKVERLMRNGKRVFASAFKAWLVEQASPPGVSVAALALANGVNANLLRHWMGLTHWQSTMPQQASLLPVIVSDVAAPVEAARELCRTSSHIEIELAGAVVRVCADVDEGLLRLVPKAVRA